MGSPGSDDEESLPEVFSKPTLPKIGTQCPSSPQPPIPIDPTLEYPEIGDILNDPNDALNNDAESEDPNEDAFNIYDGFDESRTTTRSHPPKSVVAIDWTNFTPPAPDVNNLRCCPGCPSTLKIPYKDWKKHLYDVHGCPWLVDMNGKLVVDFNHYHRPQYTSVRSQSGRKEQERSCNICYAKPMLSDVYSNHLKNKHACPKNWRKISQTPQLMEKCSINPRCKPYPVPKRSIHRKKFHPHEESEYQRDKQIKRQQRSKPTAKRKICVSSDDTVSSSEEDDRPAKQQRVKTEEYATHATHTDRELELARDTLLDRTAAQISRANIEFDNLKTQYHDHCTRMGRELPLFQSTIWSAKQLTRGLLLDEYLATQPNDLPEHLFLVLDASQANWFLKEHAFTVPIFVPADMAGDERQRCTLDRFLDKVEIFKDIDVADFTKKHSRTAQDGVLREAVRITGSKMVKRLRSQNCHLNGLNFRSTEPNPCPTWLEDIGCLNLMADFRGSRTAGKDTEDHHVDLSTNTAFVLLSGDMVMSFPHIDANGVATSITVEDGGKMWLAWPRMECRNFEDWCFEGPEHLRPPPGIDPFVVFIGPGDTFFQPSGTVHAVLTLAEEDSDPKITRCRGTMHHDSRTYDRTLMLSYLESLEPNMTNEDRLKDFKAKSRIILDLWRQGNKFYPWGSKSNLKKAETYWKYLFVKSITSCHCSDCSKEPNCECRAANRRCTIACHDNIVASNFQCGNHGGYIDD